MFDAWSLFPSVILGLGQLEVAAIKKIATGSQNPLQQPGIQLQAGFEMVIADGNGIPDGEGPPSFEFQREIYDRVLAVFDGKAPHLVQLCAHCLKVIKPPLYEPGGKSHEKILEFFRDRISDLTPG